MCNNDWITVDNICEGNICVAAMINSEFIFDEGWGESMKEEYGQDSIGFIKKAFDEFKALVEISRDRITS